MDAEGALRRTIGKFTRRFNHVEEQVQAHHGGWQEPPLPLATLDTYWDEAKSIERALERRSS